MEPSTLTPVTKQVFLRHDTLNVRCGREREYLDFDKMFPDEIVTHSLFFLEPS